MLPFPSTTGLRTCPEHHGIGGPASIVAPVVSAIVYEPVERLGTGRLKELRAIPSTGVASTGIDDSISLTAGVAQHAGLEAYRPRVCVWPESSIDVTARPVAGEEYILPEAGCVRASRIAQLYFVTPEEVGSEVIMRGARRLGSHQRN
ncbi:MAG: hypothetical protein OEW85_05285 [Acidimicrobiia bacterium]|nr:hypothetical protein [Acidimicrobiia bacterium]